MKKTMIMLAAMILAVMPMSAQVSRILDQQYADKEQAEQAVQQEEQAASTPAVSADNTLPESAVFEGELIYETYENYSDYILKMGGSIYFNGVHRVRLIVKGNWMHMIDETTGCHIIVNDVKAKAIMAKLDKKQGMSLGTLAESRSNNTYSYVHFCDHTKSGLDMSDAPGTQYILGHCDISYATGQKAPITKYGFVKTGDKKNILDQECPLYAGQIVREMGGMAQTYDVKAWVSDKLGASEGYKWNLYGLDIPGIALKWVMKYDGGHVSGFGVGELSYYIEADVVEVIPRQVQDEEFNIPAGYKIAAGGSSNAFKMYGYYNKVMKELIKRGVKGGDNSQKTTGVHFKTDEEWDF